MSPGKAIRPGLEKEHEKGEGKQQTGEKGQELKKPGCHPIHRRCLREG